MYANIDDIRNQVITTKAGQVKLGDIAVIEKGYLDPPSNIMHVNGKRAIGIGVSTDPQRDVVQTGENVKVKLNELLPLMPVGLELQSLYLENEIANEANNGFIINLIESILIVIVIIMLVMGLRAGLLIGSSLISLSEVHCSSCLSSASDSTERPWQDLSSPWVCWWTTPS